MDTTNPKDGKFYNKKFYNPEYGDFEVTGPETIRLYHGRNEPTELDFSDVWDAAYMNVRNLPT